MAANARAAISEDDRALEDALIWDHFGRVYGWTKKQVETEMPADLPARLLTIGGIRAELEKEAQERNA